ncbi:MAG: hypothetical protein KatS3mg011_1018 [Acidimicrobiia bacterium]|nr:MAG: hypothetical protein KatS3mg011_1018 [Acidimicrobiia bacterium]
MIVGLKPRGFRWVIADRLAVSDRIGGSGIQHRRVRREEEITWLVNEAGVTCVVSLLSGNQNLHAYRQAGLKALQVPMPDQPEPDDAERLYRTIREETSRPGARVLVHRETVDDLLGGLLGGYLIWTGLVRDEVLASALIQEILGRPLGPEGRALIARQ